MTAYLFTYTVCSCPAAYSASGSGARRGLAIAGIVCLAAQLIPPLAPLWLTGTALTIALLFSRLLLGPHEAPIFPISTGLSNLGFGGSQLGLPNGLQTARLAPWLRSHDTDNCLCPMQAYGWKQALIWTSLPLLLLIVSWAWYGRNRAASHPSVETEPGGTRGGSGASGNIGRNRRDLLRVLRNRDVCARDVVHDHELCVLSDRQLVFHLPERSATCRCRTVQYPAAAIYRCGNRLRRGRAGGRWTRVAIFGARRGYRILPLTMLPLAGLFLFVGVKVGSPLWAVATALSLA